MYIATLEFGQVKLFCTALEFPRMAEKFLSLHIFDNSQAQMEFPLVFPAARACWVTGERPLLAFPIPGFYTSRGWLGRPTGSPFSMWRVYGEDGC